MITIRLVNTSIIIAVKIQDYIALHWLAELLTELPQQE